MKFTPNPQQLLFLWCLATAPPRTPLNRLPYRLKLSASRKQLEQHEWITVEKVALSKRSRPLIATLTEKGWFGLEKNLTSPVQHAAATTKVLATVLAGIQRNIERGGISLADVFAELSASTLDAEPISGPSGANSSNEIRSRVYDACRRLVGDGVYGVRIRLSDLRLQLSDVRRRDLDVVLKEMERADEAAIYPFDDPREVGPADKAAALPNSSGSDRHILYLSRPK